MHADGTPFSRIHFSNGFKPNLGDTKTHEESGDLVKTVKFGAKRLRSKKANGGGRRYKKFLRDLKNVWKANGAKKRADEMWSFLRANDVPRQSVFDGKVEKQKLKIKVGKDGIVD